VLGYHYRALERFVEEERVEADGSLYRCACAAGVDELLADHRACVLRLEQELLSGELAGGVGALRAALCGPLQLLPELHALASALRREKLAGGPLLALLAERRAARGGASVALGRLAWHADAAALRQLAAWTLHGELSDPHAEFFVTRLLPEAADEAAAAAAEEADGGAAAWHSTFGLRHAQPLPPWLDLSGAEAALFVGRVTRTLGAPRGRFAHTPPSQLLPDALREGWAARLRALAAAPALRRDAVEAALGATRAEAEAALWQLVGGRARLAAHLVALRDYLLLGRGELFAALEEERQAGLPCQAAWAAAGQRCGADADPLWPLVRLLPAGAGGWEALALGFGCEWPLGCVLSPAALAQLSALSRALLRLRAAAAALQRAWAPLRRGGPRPRLAAALALRARSEALLAAWASYLQASVVEPAHAQLLQRCAAAGEPGGGGWGEAARAVAAFVAALRGGALLELPPVAAALEELALQALALERLAADAVAAGAGAPVGAAGELAGLQAGWARAAAALVAALRGVLAGAGTRAPMLRLLLDQLGAGLLGEDAAAG